MNGEYTVFLVLQNFYIGSAVFTHFYNFAGALVILHVTGDDVTVSAGTQTGEEILLQIIAVIVDRDESAISATEGHLIPAIVPPGSDVGLIHGISEAHHVVNLTPPVFADPAVAASQVGTDDRRQKIAGAVLRRARVEVVKSEGAHNARSAVRMRQHESNSHLRYDRSLLNPHF